jgi:DUF1680 family protein
MLRGRACAQAVDDQWNDTLYRTVDTCPRLEHDAALRAIPYYAWANRESGQMLVWLQTPM